LHVPKHAFDHHALVIRLHENAQEVDEAVKAG
jgi:hypothetical protein